MAKATQEERRGEMACPIGRLFIRLDKASRRKTRFSQHLNRSRLEFLKAIQALIEEAIEEMEKKESARGGKKATRIEVE